MIMYIKYDKKYVDTVDGLFDLIYNLVLGEGGDGAAWIKATDYKNLHDRFEKWYHKNHPNDKWIKTDHTSWRGQEGFVFSDETPEPSALNIFYEFFIDTTEEL